MEPQQVKTGSRRVVCKEGLVFHSRSSNYREYQGRVSSMMLLYNSSISQRRRALDSQITSRIQMAQQQTKLV